MTDRDIVQIDDPSDPRIAAFRAVKERDLVGRQGLFIAEGEVVLRALSLSPSMETVSVLLAGKRVAGLSDILQNLPSEVPVYAAGQAVMDAVAGFPIHRGILALGRRRVELSTDQLLAGLPAKAMMLVLCGISNHDNMGGLFRNAAAFGVDGVLLDSECCDPLYRKAIRVSVGAALRVPFAKMAGGTDIPTLLRGFDFAPLALSPAGATSLSRLRSPERAALLLGAEGPGLTTDVLTQCQTVSIPMAAGFDSLNVATTAGIVLHHLRHGISGRA